MPTATELKTPEAGPVSGEGGGGGGDGSEDGGEGIGGAGGGGDGLGLEGGGVGEGGGAHPHTESIFVIYVFTRESSIKKHSAVSQLFPKMSLMKQHFDVLFLLNVNS